MRLVEPPPNGANDDPPAAGLHVAHEQFGRHRAQPSKVDGTALIGDKMQLVSPMHSTAAEPGTALESRLHR